jgi:hypothetical protein
VLLLALGGLIISTVLIWRPLTARCLGLVALSFGLLSISFCRRLARFHYEHSSARWFHHTDAESAWPAYVGAGLVAIFVGIALLVL